MMSNKSVCVVTGSNKGIGFATVKELCQKFDGIVYLTSRDEQRGQDAVAQLKNLGLNPKYHQLDIDNQESINTFADYIKTTHGGLDVLVNNAAIAFKRASTVADAIQAEETIRVNYFGTLNVCSALFPLLRPHARVVNVSSSCGLLRQLSTDRPQSKILQERFISPTNTVEDISKLMSEFVNAQKTGKAKEDGWISNNYCMSKIGICALTKVQQKMLDAGDREDIVVNSCHPGYVDTDMTSHKGPKTIEEGAVSSVYLALLPPGVKEPRGQFVWEDTKIYDWEAK